MRSQTVLLVCSLLILAGIGCSNKPIDDRVNGEARPQSDGADPESSSSVSQSSVPEPNPRHSSNRIPSDETVGVWVTDDETKRLISFEEVRFQPRWPMPKRGYVPVEAMGHTLSANLHNGTTHYLANFEIKITATNRETRDILAVLSTDSVIPYFLVPPDTTVYRTIELTFGANGEEQSPFADADKWPPFDVSIEIIGARLIEDDKSG